MEQATQLLRQLKELGEAIATIIRNFGKDSSIRKTPSYYQERLKRLQTAWNDFDDIDNKLRGLKDLDKSDEYFTSDYYSKIQSLESKCLSIMERELEAQNHGSDGKELLQPRSKSPANGTSRHSGLISRSLGKMAALSRQLENLKPEPGQEEDYYAVKLTIINQLWQQLEHLHDEVLEKYPDPDRAGYDSQRYVPLEQDAQSAIIKLTSANEKLPHSTIKALPRQNTLPLPMITITNFDSDVILFGHI